MTPISLLIGTHNFLIQADLSSEQGRLKFDFRVLDKGMFSGIAVRKDRLVIARRDWYKPEDKGWEYLAGDSVVSHADLTPDGVTYGEKLTGHALYSVHQVRFDPDGTYVVETGRNQVLYFEDGYDTFHYCAFGSSMDVNHPNSVAVLSRTQAAVLLHNFAREPSQIVVLERSDLGLREIGRLALPDMGCHDMVFTRDGFLYYNASTAGELVRFDLQKKLVLDRIKIGEHCKGLCKVGDILVLGSSPKAKRAFRRDTLAELVLVSIKEWKVVGRIKPFNDIPVGNINDIVLAY